MLNRDTMLALLRGALEDGATAFAQDPTSVQKRQRVESVMQAMTRAATMPGDDLAVVAAETPVAGWVERLCGPNVRQLARTGS